MYASKYHYWTRCPLSPIQSGKMDLIIMVQTLKLFFLTFFVMFSRSVVWRSACAMCSPVWWPGRWMKPTRSARRRNIDCSPFISPDLTSWIQWAVIAINGVRFGSLHVSVVSEIFPNDIYMSSVSMAQICREKKITHPHLRFQSLEMLINCLHHAPPNCGSRRDI